MSGTNGARAAGAIGATVGAGGGLIVGVLAGSALGSFVADRTSGPREGFEGLGTAILVLVAVAALTALLGAIGGAWAMLRWRGVPASASTVARYAAAGWGIALLLLVSVAGLASAAVWIWLVAAAILVALVVARAVDRGHRARRRALDRGSGGA